MAGLEDEFREAAETGGHVEHSAGGGKAEEETADHALFHPVFRPALGGLLEAAPFVLPLVLDRGLPFLSRVTTGGARRIFGGRHGPGNFHASRSPSKQFSSGKAGVRKGEAHPGAADMSRCEASTRSAQVPRRTSAATTRWLSSGS